MPSALLLFALAQSATSNPCSSDAHGLLDFWVGRWSVSWTRNDGTTGQGRSEVSRDDHGGRIKSKPGASERRLT